MLSVQLLESFDITGLGLSQQVVHGWIMPGFPGQRPLTSFERFPTSLAGPPGKILSAYM
jgi:hypothetical protein